MNLSSDKLAATSGNGQVTQFLARLKLQRDRLDLTFVVLRAAIIIEIVVSSVFSFLASNTLHTAKCAGIKVIADYRTDIVSSISFPFIGLVVLSLLSNKIRIIDAIKYYDGPSPQERTRITISEFVFYCAAIGCIFWLGSVMGSAITRYNTFAQYCRQ